MGFLGEIGSIIGGGIGGHIDSERDRKNAQDAAYEQQKFQERMSNTAHQREVKDLRAAGLNPILSATGGQGASSPAGSLAQMPTSKVASSALDALRVKNEIKKVESEINLNEEAAKKMRQDAEVSSETKKLVQAQTMATAGDAQKKSVIGSVWQKAGEIAKGVTKISEEMANSAKSGRMFDKQRINKEIEKFKKSNIKY